jgi:DNA repair protein SbcD/Mre11
VIIAGDLYDGDWKDYATGQFFVREAARLVRVKASSSSSFAATTMRPAKSAVHVAAARWRAPVLHPQGRVRGTRRSRRRPARPQLRPAPCGRKHGRRVPAARPGWCNIGILHTSLTGRDGHDVYAPCSLDDLLRVGYQYWALGHVHAREVVHADPPIVFPGNLQGRHARETRPKGGDARHRRQQRRDRPRGPGTRRGALGDCPRRHRRLERRYRSARCRSRRRGAAGTGACEGRPLALRLRLTGATELHAHLVADASASPRNCRPSPRRCRTRSISKGSFLTRRRPRVAGTLGLPVGRSRGGLCRRRRGPEFRQDLSAHLALIRAKAPREALEPGGGEDPTSTPVLAQPATSSCRASPPGPR